MNIRLGRKGPHNEQPEEHGGNCFDDLCKDSPLLFWIREREKRERERERGRKRENASDMSKRINSIWNSLQFPSTLEREREKERECK